MRQRLRSLPEPGDLAAMYPEPHDHRRYGRGHGERVAATIGGAVRLANNRLSLTEPPTLADLSCGNGAVLQGIEKYLGTSGSQYGDFAPGWPIEGPIEQTLDKITEVDLFICAETLEHLDDPDTVLKEIRKKARGLLLSTPVWAWDDANGEHLWAWSVGEVSLMLEAAQWRPLSYTEVDSTLYGEPYIYGIWGCI